MNIRASSFVKTVICTSYSLRLLPYIVSSIEKWKGTLLREKDLTDFIAADISC